MGRTVNMALKTTSTEKCIILKLFQSAMRRRGVYPEGFCATNNRRKPENGPQSETVLLIEEKGIQEYTRALARRDDLPKASTTFVVIRLPNNSRIYEWFVEGTTMPQIYDFARFHYPKVRFIAFSLTTEDGTVLPDNPTQLLPICPSSELMLQLRL
jgi:hypothetical protein